MAEVLGIVSGTLSIAGLFNNCVDCFGYIQFGRHFGHDYQRCQLRLDVAKNRLARWGAAVGINNEPRFQSDASNDRPTQLARSIIEEILLQFQSASKVSQRYEISADPNDLIVFQESDLGSPARGLHNHLETIVKQRRDKTNLVRKASWALYDKKNLEGIIEKIVMSIEELERVFPAETVHRVPSQIEIEIEEVNDNLSLHALKDAANSIDEPLSDAISEKLHHLSGWNSTRDIQSDEHARVNVGTVMTVAALNSKFPVDDEKTNSVRDVSAKGRSRVNVGNTFGSRGIWDD